MTHTWNQIRSEVRGFHAHTANLSYNKRQSPRAFVFDELRRRIYFLAEEGPPAEDEDLLDDDDDAVHLVPLVVTNNLNPDRVPGPPIRQPAPPRQGAVPIAISTLPSDTTKSSNASLTTAKSAVSPPLTICYIERDRA
jgi:hypothetical protein